MSLTFDNVLDDAIVLYLENFAAFVAFINTETGGGAGQYKVDLDMRQVTYLPKLVKRNEVVVPLHLAATLAAESNDVLWAWANPKFGEAPVARLSSRVREFGQQQGIDRFATDSHPVPEGVDPGMYAIAIAACACRITGMPVAQVLPHTNAQELSMQTVLLLDPANFRPPAPSSRAFAGLIGQTMSTGLVSDGRRAVQGYAQARGLPYRWADGFTSIELAMPDGPLQVAFDEQGRPTVEESNSGGAGGGEELGI